MKKRFNAVDLAGELERLVADKDKVKTHSEISEWLVRLYTVAGKLTIAQETLRGKVFTGESAETVRQIVNEFVLNMLLLHNMAEDALAKMEEKELL